MTGRVLVTRIAHYDARTEQMGADRLPARRLVARGLVAGLAGNVAMTVVQKLVEMPLTGRQDSYAPALFAEKVLRLRSGSPRRRLLLNYAMHVSLGLLGGAAYGGVAALGGRSPAAIGSVFGFIYIGDLSANTALGLYRPSTWSAQDWAIDIGNKLLQVAVTGLVFERGQAHRDPAPARVLAGGQG